MKDDRSYNDIIGLKQSSVSSFHIEANLWPEWEFYFTQFLWPQAFIFNFLQWVASKVLLGLSFPLDGARRTAWKASVTRNRIVQLHLFVEKGSTHWPIHFPSEQILPFRVLCIYSRASHEGLWSSTNNDFLFYLRKHFPLCDWKLSPFLVYKNAYFNPLLVGVVQVLR